MKKKIMILFAAFLAVLIALVPIISGKSTAVSAHADDVALAKTSSAALLIDADTGTVVFEKNVDKHLPIASMVKIMTLSLAFDEIERRGIDYDSMVIASENAASMGGSQAFLDANAQYRLDELLKSIVVASANDSCVAVAEYLYGSVDAFVSEMNKRASEWGMENTAFVNCTGLPKDGQYCCARDVAIMFGKLIEHERFFDYAKVWMYDFEHPDGRTTRLTNTNKLIRFYEGCDGGKTGYTDAARSCLTVTAKRGDTRLVCVSIGAENSKTRNKEVSEMLNYGFANYKTVFAVRRGDKIGEFAVDNGKTDKIGVVAKDDCSAFVKSGEQAELVVTPEIGKIAAPIKRGDKVGELKITLDGEQYACVDAVASDSVAQKGYLDIVDDFIEKW